MVESVLPWGMPSVIVRNVDCALVVCVDCFLLIKYVLKNCVVVSLKLNWWRSLWMSLSCEIVSYAFERSANMASVGNFCFMNLKMSHVTLCSARVVLDAGRKAYCVLERI